MVETQTILRQIRGYCLEWGYIYSSGTNINKLDAKQQFQFLPGCFDKCLSANPDIALTKDLDGVTVFARTGDGTLRLESDDVGLLVTADLVDTPQNRNLCELIDGGKIRGWSHHAGGMLFPAPRRDVIETVTSLRRVGDALLRTYHQIALDQVTLVIKKHPRARTRKTPIFLAGGPAAKDGADVL